MDEQFPLLICRYGAGCSHNHTDPMHSVRYYHPPVNRDVVVKDYYCNECGLGVQIFEEMRWHLQKKTAWSHNSLIGSRICCLINDKEWHEGIVQNFHHSGRHFVHFVGSGHGIWLHMLTATFHIIQDESHYNPTKSDLSNECKVENETPTQHSEEEGYVYMEQLSSNYVYAQSLLTNIYGLVETGHKTRGHTCVTDKELKSVATKDSFLYGELLPRGVNKALLPSRLNAIDASVLFDLGMGTGKIPIQVFLQFPNLELVYGVELSQARYDVAQQAALDLVKLLGEQFFDVEITPERSITITQKMPLPLDGNPRGLYTGRQGRVLKLECGDMFNMDTLDKADIIMLETEIPTHLHPQLCALLRTLKTGGRTLTYVDLRQIWSGGQCAFRQMEVNRHVTDRYSTSWSVQRGHHFLLWIKTKIPGEPFKISKTDGSFATSTLDSLTRFFARDKVGVLKAHSRVQERNPEDISGACFPSVFSKKMRKITHTDAYSGRPDGIATDFEKDKQSASSLPRTTSPGSTRKLHDHNGFIINDCVI